MNVHLPLPEASPPVETSARSISVTFKGLVGDIEGVIQTLLNLADLFEQSELETRLAELDLHAFEKEGGEEPMLRFFGFVLASIAAFATGLVFFESPGWITFGMVMALIVVIFAVAFRSGADLEKFRRYIAEAFLGGILVALLVLTVVLPSVYNRGFCIRAVGCPAGGPMVADSSLGDLLWWRSDEVVVPDAEGASGPASAPTAAVTTGDGVHVNRGDLLKQILPPVMDGVAKLDAETLTEANAYTDQKVGGLRLDTQGVEEEARRFIKEWDESQRPDPVIGLSNQP